MEWIRCPVCGKKARAGGIGRAGSHQLGVLRVRGLGRGKGFKHFWSEISPEVLESIRQALLKALDQVETMLKIAQNRAINEKIIQTYERIYTTIQEAIKPKMEVIYEPKERIYPGTCKGGSIESPQGDGTDTRRTGIPEKVRVRERLRVSIV